jgi:hypothetical protein
MLGPPSGVVAGFSPSGVDTDPAKRDGCGILSLRGLFLAG